MPRDIDSVRTTDGVRVRLLVRGDGPPLVFASNAFGDAHFCRSLHPHTRRMTDGLAERGWRVARYDLRGMGASDRDIPAMSAEGLGLDLPPKGLRMASSR